MTDVTQTDEWKYQANLHRAQTTPLPVQVNVTCQQHGIHTFVFAKAHAKRLAQDIAPEISFVVTGSGDTSEVEINFGLPWNDRLIFLEILGQQYGHLRGAQRFFELVEDATHDFVTKIDEVT